MSDPVAEALREAESACPCFTNAYACQPLVCEHKPQVWAATNTQAIVPERGSVVPCLWPGHAAISRLVSLARQAGQEVGAALQRYGGVSKICGKHEVDALADRPLDQYCALCEIAAARLAGIAEGRLEQAEKAATEVRSYDTTALNRPAIAMRQALIVFFEAERTRLRREVEEGKP